MATVQEAMSEWGRGFLRDKGYEVADDAIIFFEDDIEYGGYCETCSYEDYVVRVTDGNVTHTYYGRMSALLDSMNEGVYY